MSEDLKENTTIFFKNKSLNHAIPSWSNYANKDVLDNNVYIQGKYYDLVGICDFLNENVDKLAKYELTFKE